MRLQYAFDGCTCIVDVTRVQVPRQRGQETVLWSGKDKFCALKYEVACTISNPRIIWVNGPFVGSDSDLTIARADLLNILQPGERVLADKGYRGPDAALWTPIWAPANQAERYENRLHSQIRSKIERVNRRIKIFKCFDTIWRHDFEFNGDCFVVACLIVNILLAERPL
jgi:hypothetical protein